METFKFGDSNIVYPPHPPPEKKNGDSGFAHIPHHKNGPKQMLRDEPKPKINMLVAFINLFIY